MDKRLCEVRISSLSECDVCPIESVYHSPTHVIHEHTCLLVSWPLKLKRSVNAQALQVEDLCIQ